MTSFSSIRSLLTSPQLEGQVALRGWIYRTRSSGKIVFAVVRDSTGIIQVTIKKGNLPDDRVRGRPRPPPSNRRWRSSAPCTRTTALPAATRSGASALNVIGAVAAVPITEYQSEELLLDNRHLWIRSREQNAVMKIKASAMKGAREWLDENEFHRGHPARSSPRTPARAASRCSN